MSLVAAVVPTFRPDPVALASLVASLTAARVPALVADDASPCTSDPALCHVASMGAGLVRHRENAGIARSLNDGLRFAVAQGAFWLLTVDQDSDLAPEYVSSLVEAAASATAILGSDRVGAVAAGTISDASGAIDYPLHEVSGVQTTPEVIQTERYGTSAP